MDTPKEKTTRKARQSYTHAKADARRDKRRQEAEARQRVYDGLSIKDRLALAKSRPGSSKREVARLEGLLAKKPEPKAEVVATVQVAATEEAKPKRTPKSKVTRAAKSERPSKS